MKKVSIITPVYGTEKYLPKCIESVLNNDYKNIEFIIINDGSKGNCDEIVNSYHDERIKYINQKNGGIGNARNNGIKSSTGDYLLFLDSDDDLASNAISKMVNLSEEKGYDIVVTNYQDIYQGNNKVDKINLPDIQGNIYNNPSLINNINLGPSNKLFKKELFNNLSFPENVKYEDFALVLKLISKSLNIGHVEDYLFNFNRLNTGETLVVDKRVYDIFKSLDETLDYFNKLKYPKKEIKEKVMNEVYYFITKMCTLYASKSKYQKDKEVKYKFIDDAYDYLKNNVPDYKHNKYFKDCSFIKRTIQKNKFLLKIYCML